MPRVVNLRARSRFRPEHGENFVYVGRPTVYGNPFSELDRCASIAAFTEWVMAPEQAHLRARARVELRGKSLACYCYPRPCHANVWLRIANEETDR